MTSTARALNVAAVLVALTACGPNESTIGRNDAGTTADGGNSGGGGAGGGGGANSGGGPGGGTGGGAPDAGPHCTPPPPPTGAGVSFAAEFAALYAVYELGPPPGVPGPLGGCVILKGRPDELLIVGESERATAAIYRVPIRRDGCGHIVGYLGASTKLGDAPYADANLLQTSDEASLLYTGWNVSQFSQWRLATGTPAWTVSLPALGFTGDSAGGLGVVPRALPGRGGHRIVGWPDGKWHELSLAADAGSWSITHVTYAGIALPNGPGGFAYVPAGSPGFSVQSLILAEWSAGSVAVYQVDDDGNPRATTRRDFFTTFPLPWGAYFEPQTGDFLFLTWGRAGQADSLFVVQGFTKPEEIN